MAMHCITLHISTLDWHSQKIPAHTIFEIFINVKFDFGLTQTADLWHHFIHLFIFIKIGLLYVAKMLLSAAPVHSSA